MTVTAHIPVFGGIGQNDLPGLAKMVEENGEALQEIGKIYQIGHDGQHWDGKKDTLRVRLQKEMADQLAAISFFCEVNGFDMDKIDKRVKKKYARFHRWHRNVLAGRDPNDNGTGSEA